MSAMTGAPDDASSAPAIDLQEAIEFIWREADLLDQGAYAEWLAVWTDTGRYVIPIDRSDADPASHLNIAYDDKEMREARVRRLTSGLAVSATPPARTVRTISRFRRIRGGHDSLELRCAQHLIEYKYDRSRMLAADLTYRLARKPTGLELDQKIVRLINSDEALFGIGYLL